MSKRELLTGIWLMSMALLSLFTFTVFFVAQMSPDILDIVCPILAAVQCITLVIYLWGPEKLKSTPLKLLYRLMYATSILVIPVFVFSFSGNSSCRSDNGLQYRNGLCDLSGVFQC